ncbi:MAG TPA: hypothetical protein VIT20_09875 [Propionibacteriaceae bacterium]
MQIGRARELAAAWVAGRSDPGLIGAFYTGSSVDLGPADELAAESDLDLVLVVEGGAPDKLGKLTHDGVRLDVSSLSRAGLADGDAVARTHWLAPSFRGGAIIADPTGELHRVEAHVSRIFADPEVVASRCASVAERIRGGLDSWSEGRSWPDRVMRWVFPASLTTHLVLVAGLQNPTVRLRYRAARDLLAERGRAEVYPTLLDHLGVRHLTPGEVAGQLRPVAEVFDAAAAVNQHHFPFASDLTADARDIAVGGSERLILAGDHREAVFWLVVTLVRAQLILDHDGDPAEAAGWAKVTSEAIAALTGLRTEADLVRRTAEVRAFLPELHEVVGQTGLSS